jgi:hypothetical protein
MHRIQLGAQHNLDQGRGGGGGGGGLAATTTATTTTTATMTRYNQSGTTMPYTHKGAITKQAVQNRHYPGLETNL